MRRRVGWQKERKLRKGRGKRREVRDAYVEEEKSDGVGIYEREGSEGGVEL